MLKFRRKDRARKRNTLEVSIVGGGFSWYQLPFSVELAPGSFIFIKERNSEYELLVKVRGVSSKPAQKILDRYRIASKEEVIRIMKNMTRGFLFENNMLDIKIVKEEFDMNVGLISFTYTAEKKYTMAKIASQLSKILHVRVEFKQIGARDYARVVGGLGLCGRELCCRIFLKEIPPVTLDMAREQYLFAAPEKLSGICGRLLCCLRYELDFYREAKSKLPEIGSTIETEKGPGKVVEVNVISGRVRVQYPDETEEVINFGTPKEHDTSKKFS